MLVMLVKALDLMLLLTLELVCNIFLTIRRK